MTIETAITKGLIVPIYTHLKGKAIDKIKLKINKSVSIRLKKEFIKSTEFKILEKYGDATFYQSLSKLLLKTDFLEKCYERCYNIASKEYVTDSEFVSIFVNTSDMGNFDKQQTIEILDNILTFTFNFINEKNINAENIAPTNLTIHSINEYVNRLFKEKDAKDEIRFNQLAEKIDANAQVQNLNLFDLFSHIKLVCSENTNLELSINSKEGTNYKVKTIVKYIGLIAEFDSFQKYLNHLTFSGKSDTLEVYESILYDENENTYSMFKSSETGCKLFAIDDFYTNNIQVHSFPNENDKVYLTITPENTKLVISFENNEGDVICDNLIFSIERERINANDVECILKAKNDFIDITFKIHGNSGGIIGTDFNIVPVNFTNANTSIKYWKAFRAITNSETLILRDMKTHFIYIEFNKPQNPKTLEYIDNMINLLKKIIYIQDRHKINIVIPTEITGTDQNNIQTIYNLTKNGKAYLHKELEFSDNSQSDSFRDVNDGTILGLHANLTYLPIFDQEIQLNDHEIIIPEVRITKSENTIQLTSISRTTLQRKAPGNIQDKLQEELNKIN